MLKNLLLILFLCFFCLGNSHSFAQNPKNDSTQIRKIYDEALLNPVGYAWLRHLCLNIGGRLSGSPQAAAAVEYTYQVLDTLGADQVFLQELKVPHWVRGPQEIGRIVNSNKLGTVEVNICALGQSIGTGPQGIVAPILEVGSFDEMNKLGADQIEGKIVFYNVPMDQTQINSFAAYSKAVRYRYGGASEAAKLGALGVVVRSVSTALDDYPHTGSMGYALNVPKIPAVAISTRDAELLSKLLQDQKNLTFYMETQCEMRDEKTSYNVVAEILGSEKPEEIIVVGGHLDSWDTGHGAHDDGAGIVQSMEVIRLFKTLGIQPKRTIRAVMFMNEENGLAGGKKYAELAKENQEIHLAAIESDNGGFSPIALGISNQFGAYEAVNQWAELFAPYNLKIRKGGGGADISPLVNQGTHAMSLVVDSQRYFDLHHASTDTFDKVNRRELQLGAAAMASLVYLIDLYGLPSSSR